MAIILVFLNPINQPGGQERQKMAPNVREMGVLLFLSPVAQIRSDAFKNVSAVDAAAADVFQVLCRRHQCSTELLMDR